MCGWRLYSKKGLSFAIHIRLRIDLLTNTLKRIPLDFCGSKHKSTTDGCKENTQNTTKKPVKPVSGWKDGYNGGKTEIDPQRRTEKKEPREDLSTIKKFWYCTQVTSGTAILVLMWELNSA